ncbi:unnamed protein product [Haemonchus placei]|uniref:Craniofacial development protein 2-like n=1 Tax=Haemonchus placei TaxID=6290 RepID=A0A0N4WNM7_HAEPC|nr:unnamed protein product [Haemonchus placei]
MPLLKLEKSCSLEYATAEVGGVGVLVNTHLAMNIDPYESLITRIGRFRLGRRGPTSALTVFVIYAPTLSYDEEELEAFYMDLEKLYKEDHTFFKVIVGEFNAKIGPRRTAEGLHIGTHGMERNEQGERLSVFIRSTYTIHGSSQFQHSHLLWTWESPGGQFHIETDHTIVNRKFCLTVVAVFFVVCCFFLSSTRDQTTVYSTRFLFSVRGERAANFRKRGPETDVNWNHFASLASLWEDSVSDNIDEK